MSHLCPQLFKKINGTVGVNISETICRGKDMWIGVVFTGAKAEEE